METKKCSIKRGNDKTSLILHFENQELEIILTDDNPNQVKGVFNKLILELKKGTFDFQLEDSGTDLFNEIGTEYIKQLNSELLTIRQELEDLGLIRSDEENKL